MKTIIGGDLAGYFKRGRCKVVEVYFLYELIMIHQKSMKLETRWTLSQLSHPMTFTAAFPDLGSTCLTKSCVTFPWSVFYWIRLYRMTHTISVTVRDAAVEERRA